MNGLKYCKICETRRKHIYIDNIAWEYGGNPDSISATYFEIVLNYNVPLVITGYGNNITNNDSLWIWVNQGTNVRFNMTTYLRINSNTTVIQAGVTSLGNDTLGKTTFWVDFLFPDYGTKYVNMEVKNTTSIQNSTNWTISKEPPDNLNLWGMHEKELKADVPTSYIFTTPELDLYEILINPSKDLGVVSLKVELLKGLSRIEGIISPPYEIYKFINIWSGYMGFEKQDRDAIISFRVDNKWVDGKNIDGRAISLLRWNGIKWISLETQVKYHDEKYSYFQAKTNSFGAFAIGSIPLYSKITPAIQISETPSLVQTFIQPTVEQKFPWEVYILFALIVIGIIIYILRYEIIKWNKSQ